MGAAARTMLALYCANAAVGRLAATPARAGPTPLAARALTVEGGAREATHDAVETENRERLRAAGVTSQNTLLRRRPAPPAARAAHRTEGLHNNARGRGARARGPRRHVRRRTAKTGAQHRYEAYNSLHSLANAYRKPIEVPAVVVVGAQSAGKSALVEALMGFQFNEVGGGTRTRRPIALQMHYNAACDEPACYIMDERFTGGEPVEGGAQFERRASASVALSLIHI